MLGIAACPPQRSGIGTADIGGLRSFVSRRIRNTFGPSLVSRAALKRELSGTILTATAQYEIDLPRYVGIRGAQLTKHYGDAYRSVYGAIAPNTPL